jgi:CRP-like cAMP-binding protein
MRADELDVAPIERVLALRALREFETLTPTDLALIADLARPRRFAEGELLMRPGVPISGLHFLLEGEVRIDREGTTSQELGPREVVGDLAAMFRDAPAPRIVALEPSATLELVRTDIEEIFEDDFPIFLGALRSLARRLSLSTPVLTRARAVEPVTTSIGPLSLVDRVVALRRSMEFAGTEIEALADLAQQALDFSLPARGELWKLGDDADHFVVLIEGRVRAVTPRHSDLCFGPGHALGALESLSGAPRGYTVVADTDVRALRIDALVLLDLIEDNVALGSSLLCTIAQRLGEHERSE